MVRIGIPRAFLYYKYYPLWDTFFKQLGVEVVVSPESNKDIVKRGTMNTVDEACLPLKVFIGHVLELTNAGVDFLFIPRFISIEKHRYLCPKFLALPDVVRGALHRHQLPAIVEPIVDVWLNKKEFYKELLSLAYRFSKNPIVIYKAIDRAVSVHQAYLALLQSGMDCNEALRTYRMLGYQIAQPSLSVQEDTKQYSPHLAGAEQSDQPMHDKPMKIAVITHPYILYDRHISMNLVKKLQAMNCVVSTVEMVNQRAIDESTEDLTKDLFWTMNREIVGAAFHHRNQQDIDGMIILTAFSCGPDAITKELIERVYKRQLAIPLLSLTIDEHTGEAGLITRLEAFLDMIKRKDKGAEKYESDVSAYGEFPHRSQSVVSNAGH